MTSFELALVVTMYLIRKLSMARMDLTYSGDERDLMTSNLQPAIEFLNTHGIQSMVMHDLSGIFCRVRITRHIKNHGDIECSQIMFIINHNDMWFASVNGLGQIDVVIRKSNIIVTCARALIDFVQLNNALQYKNAEIQNAFFTLQNAGCITELVSAISLEFTCTTAAVRDAYKFMIEAGHTPEFIDISGKHRVVWKQDHWELLLADSEPVIQTSASPDIAAFAETILFSLRENPGRVRLPTDDGG